MGLLNSNSDPAQVTIEIWGADGNMIATTAITIGPRSRAAAYLDSLFPGTDPVLLGHLRIRSDKALYGLAIINGPDYNFVPAMPMIPSF